MSQSLYMLLMIWNSISFTVVDNHLESLIWILHILTVYGDFCRVSDELCAGLLHLSYSRGKKSGAICLFPSTWCFCAFSSTPLGSFWFYSVAVISVVQGDSDWWKWKSPTNIRIEDCGHNLFSLLSAAIFEVEITLFSPNIHRNEC